MGQKSAVLELFMKKKKSFQHFIFYHFLGVFTVLFISSGQSFKKIIHHRAWETSKIEIYTAIVTTTY